MQPQGHVQMVINWLDFGMNLQEAGDAARFLERREKLVFLEFEMYLHVAAKRREKVAKSRPVPCVRRIQRRLRRWGLV